MGPAGQIALQGGIDIAGGIVGNLFQKRNIRLQKEANLEMANYAYDKDKEMWNLQNLYNSPKAQMQRFEEAKLSPNLIYGKGTAGNATTMPKRQSVTAGLRQTNVPTPNVMGMLQQYANIKNTQADTDYKTELGSTQSTVALIRELDRQKSQMEVDWSLGRSKYAPGRNNYQAWMNKRQQMQQTQYDSMSQRYNLDTKKFALLDAQINNALWEAKTKERKYHWMPWEKGFGMASKAAGIALGAKGISKIGRNAAGKFTKGTATKLKKPKIDWNAANRAFSQRHNPW